MIDVYSGLSVPAELTPAYAGVTDGIELLARTLTGPMRGRVAVVSSFGAESAVLLALAAEIDPAVPVIFLETGKHFPETLAYRDRLASLLGLVDVRDIRPDPVALDDEDPIGNLHEFDADGCCAVRKVAPLARALHGFEAWISGRKRHQASTRTALAFIEPDQGRWKINPLADWTPARIAAEHRRRNLPTHSLVAAGYPSIGCAPCTRPVAPGESARAGRWAGLTKTECGIHRAPAGGFVPAHA